MNTSTGSPRWYSQEPEVAFRRESGDGLRIALRGLGVAGLIAIGLIMLIPLRLVERLRHGSARPWTPWIVHWVSRACRFALGLRCIRRGLPMTSQRLAFVSNHVSWLDVLSLNAETCVTFVAKAEVADWPGIGAIARAAGTIFIERDPRKVAQQADLLADRIQAGHRILIFAEGTSSDGTRVLPFRASLFAAFLKAAPMDLQPVTLRYTAPQGQDARFYGWWGGMEFGPSLRAVLASKRPGRLTVTFHDPIPVDARSQRKALAKNAEMAVRSAL